MKNRIKAHWWLVPAAALAAALLLRACGPRESRRVALDPAEAEWLEAHRDTIRYAPLPDSPPIDFLDPAGRHEGLTADYVRLIEQQLGIRFVRVRCASWKEILEKLRNHEIDLVGSIQERPERRAFLNFTEPYFQVRNVILTRKEWRGTQKLENMASMRIAIVDGSATFDHVREKHPDLVFVPVVDAATGFRMVSFGEVEAMVADMGVASYYIEEMGISNLRVAGIVDYPWELRFGARKDWPQLSAIMGKALAGIPAEQRRAIGKQWITLQDVVTIPRTRYLKVVGAILLFTLLAIGLFVFWNRNLRRQATRHLHELGRVRQSHDQATRALGRSEGRFRALVETSTDMIWEMDPYGCYSYVSPRSREILGYEPVELVGQSALSLMVPADAARAIAALRKSIPGTNLGCETCTFVRKDGRRVVLESSGMAFAGNTGELAGFRGVSRDITGRIEAENALRRSEERFRNLVETTSDWIWEVDTEGRYTYASPQSADLLGYAPAELLGRHFADLMPPAEAKATKASFARTVEQGAPIHSFVSTNRHKAGRTVVLETSAVPFYDKDWNIQGYRGIDRDITDRVATEKQLEFERNLFRSFMAHAPDLIYFKDAEGRFIEVNAAKAEEVHRTPDELVGMGDFDFLPPEQARQRHDDEAEVMRTRRPIQKEELATTPDGPRWYLSTKVPRYDSEGRVVGTFGTSWDITHRKLAEEELRRLRALLANTIDSMPSILVGVDADGRVIQWNRQAELAVGLAAIDALGKPLAETFPGLDRQMVKVGRAIRERRSQTEQRIAVASGDRTRYQDITVYPLLGGDVAGAVIRVDDVTERVMIEDSIRNIVEGVAAVGRRFFGSMASQLAKTMGADFAFIAEFCGEDPGRMRTIAAADKDGAAGNFDFAAAGTPCEQVLAAKTCIHVAGSRAACPGMAVPQSQGIESFIGIPLLDSEKNPQGAMVALYRKPVEQVEFATSIMQVFAGRTAAELERLQATKELVALRNLLQNILDSMPSILVGVDAEGRVVQWNREAERITGIEAARAQRQPLARVFPDFGREMARLLDALGGRELQRHERIHCTMGGDRRVVDVTIYPLSTDGAEGAVVRIDDVTDRVRIEEMMVQSEKMMSVGGLAAGMAHEINNPLAGILQNLQVMRNRIMHDTDRNQAAAAEAGTSLEAVQAYMQARGLVRMMDAISDAGQRAAKIVDNMLSFSRKDEAFFAPNDLKEILDRSVELASNDYNLKKRFDFRHIRIVREYDGALGPVPCEGSQIQQVVLNLLSNSAQAMAGQGGGREPRITLRLKREPGAALVEVEDNGPGMDDETRRRVFEPFFTTKEVGSGTGLGLSVSYFIVTENHGGTMAVASTPGRGACFSIRIPFRRKAARQGLRI